VPVGSAPVDERACPRGEPVPVGSAPVDERACPRGEPVPVGSAVLDIGARPASLVGVRGPYTHSPLTRRPSGSVVSICSTRVPESEGP
jgi:hypothetical protein